MAKILLVEDDNNLREIYEARLQAEGYDIVAAQDGEAALVVAKQEQPDLVISDVMMPRISGFEMLDILRNTQGMRDVKVIMLTALGQAEDKTRADKLGADRYLVKSQVTLEDIVHAAAELLGGNAAAGDTPAPAAEPEASAMPAPTSEPMPVTAAPVATPAPEPTVAVPAPVVAAVPELAATPTPVVTPPEPAATPALDPIPAGNPFPPVSAAPTPAADPISAAPPAVPEPQVTPADPGTPPATPAPTPSPAAPVPDAPAPETPIATPPTPIETGEQAITDTLESLIGGTDANKPLADPMVTEPTPTTSAEAPTEPTDNTPPVAAEDESAATLETPPEPAPVSPEAAQAPAAAPVTDDNADTTTRKKIIQPLDPTGQPVQPDLNELLAKEGITDFDKVEQQAPAASYAAQAQPTAGMPHPHEQTAQLHAPGHVITPGSAQPTGNDGKPIDPNSIAL
jgi:CheY-like chemotaxis protein